MKKEEIALNLLRKAIEEKAGFCMRTPKDFDLLSEYISEETHQKVSSSTLKRFWGYLSEASVPRVSTLDILSQYAGYSDWASFMEQTPEPSSKLRTHASWAIGGGYFYCIADSFCGRIFLFG